MSAPLCQAKQPVPVFPRTWQICGRPTAAVHRYRCACGHERTGATCAEHAPAPGEVGCSQCWDEGHDCPMEVTR